VLPECTTTALKLASPEWAQAAHVHCGAGANGPPSCARQGIVYHPVRYEHNTTVALRQRIQLTCSLEHINSCRVLCISTPDVLVTSGC
jgi:hypothetical protein